MCSQAAHRYRSRLRMSIEVAVHRFVLRKRRSAVGLVSGSRLHGQALTGWMRPHREQEMRRGVTMRAALSRTRA